MKVAIIIILSLTCLQVWAEEDIDAKKKKGGGKKGGGKMKPTFPGPVNSI